MCRAVGVSLCCVVDMVVEYALINKYINRIYSNNTNMANKDRT